MIPGILNIMPGVTSAPFSVSFIGSNNDPTNASTHTYSTEAIGTADSRREIFVLVSWTGPNAARAISSATIGGVGATIHTQDNLSDGVDEHIGSGIISAAVPSGTTGDIVINWAGAVFGSGIGKVGVYNRTALTDTDSLANTGTDPHTISRSVDVAQGGAVLACAAFSTASGTAFAWTGATEQYESTIAGAGGEGFRYGGALITGLSSETGRNVQVSMTGDGSTNGGSISVVTIA